MIESGFLLAVAGLALAIFALKKAREASVLADHAMKLSREWEERQEAAHRHNARS
jgi:hypothetical protein